MCPHIIFEKPAFCHQGQKQTM